ncbi:MAG: peptide deformylase [Acidimicrobiales bacterium]
MAIFPIRVFGDPVLRQRSAEIEEIDGKVARLSEEMVETLYSAHGVGLAAPQVGIERRIFVYDVGDGPKTVINPVIVESSGEWEYVEGCLSVPDLSWPIVRPMQVHMVGRDLDGNEVSIEGDELLGRVLQHELDHLDGVLLLQRLDKAQRKEAMRILRGRVVPDVGGGAVGDSLGA